MNDSSFPWQTAIQYLKGVGPKRAFLLEKLDLHTLEDLLYYIPFRYEDRRSLKKISELSVSKLETVVGEVLSISSKAMGQRRLSIVEMTFSDTSGTIAAKWFNQGYISKSIKKGDRLMLSGPIKVNRFSAQGLEFDNPVFERLDDHDEQLHLGRIVPIYHETKGFSSRQIRVIVHDALEKWGKQIPEMLPAPLIQKFNLPSLAEAISQTHFPNASADLTLLNEKKSLVQKRLIFDELFLLETGLALRQQGMTEKVSGICFKDSDVFQAPLRQLIPFELTDAQERVLKDIKQDMERSAPMNRLIQGDVGCGKTLVALMAIVVAMGSGYQCALMAPTEILAEQHYLSLKTYLAPLGKTVLLLTSDMKKKEKDAVLVALAKGDCDLLIGTHALIQKSVQFKNLGLAVVDEQHKFGVLQRVTLAQKGIRPDVLIMTATPIPRSLALTLYGDLNFSVIDELPPGRSPIKTRLFYGKQRDRVYTLIRKEIERGRQAFIVCPLVDESEKMDLKAAIVTYEELQQGFFKDYKVALLHGKMKRDEKERVMHDFKKGDLDLLIATTVVEVGIDIPNATVMTIEHAERFGLSQLHQLRGRVGRGAQKSHCFLIAEYPISKEGKRRLKVMVESNDGFKISEEDLSIRGPGEFFGTRQSGIPLLKLANLIRDARILEAARKEAFDWVGSHPGLEDPESQSIRVFLERKWQGKLEWLSIA